MSKAIIVKHLGDAKYRVRLQFDISAIKARIKALTKRIDTATANISGDLQTAVTAALDTLNAISIPEGIAAESDQMSQIMVALEAARRAYDDAVRALATEKAVKENAVNERSRLLAYDEEKELDIWCADYTTNLKEDDEVGVIDWYQFRGRSTPGNPVIIPAHLTGKEAVYSSIRDGRNVPPVTLGPYGWWYAMSFVPGMERFNPHYRKGEIIAINADGTVNVTVDDVYTQVLHASADDMTTQEIDLVNVPVRYLTCNAGAFEVHDRVVLEYPRKNIHKDLAAMFKVRRESLQVAAAELNQKIIDVGDLITQSEADILALEVIVSEKNNLLNEILATEGHLQSAVDNAKAEIELAVSNLAEEQKNKNRLQNSKIDLQARLSDTNLEVVKMQTLEEDELSKYSALKAYTDTRPKEITVIGFVEKPRPCEGIAFQNSSGAWRLVKPNGKESALGTAPALAGQFNWGVQNEDGIYDCACVWSGSTVRHGGHNYNLSTTVVAAGVIKDFPYEGVFTIKAIKTQPPTNPPSITVLSVIVKDGTIVKTTENAVTGWVPRINNALLPDAVQRPGFLLQPCDVSASILIDKSGLFAVAADSRSYVIGSNWLTSAFSKIKIIDLQTYFSDQVSYYDTTGEFGPGSGGTDYQPDHWDYGLPESIRYEHDTLTYGVDGEIMLVGRLEMDRTPSYVTSAIYCVVNFKNRIINTVSRLYSDFVEPENYSDLNSYGLLCTVVDDNSIYPIMINRHAIGGGPGALPYATQDTLMLAHDQRIIGTTPDISEHYTLLPYYDFQPPFDYVLKQTSSRDSGDVTSATVRGFSAGCVKVKSVFSPNMWVEFRGTKYKLVDQPSTDYTILI